MKTEENKSVFEVLNAINVNGHTEKKKTGSTELTYLSWAWAWAEIKKQYPEASYTIYRDEQGHPYVEDEDFGLMCYTSVTIGEQTYDMWLPVMNGANKAMKRKPYTYKVWSYVNKKFEEKEVEAATMFDINKTIMRCLVKNLAMFGLGLYIYAGEDLPDAETVKVSEKDLQEAYEVIADNIKTAPSRKELQTIYNNNPALLNYKPFTDALNKRWEEVR